MTIAILFFIFAFVFRGLYDSIPFLLSIALSVILAFCTIFSFRLFSKEFVRMNNFVLKHSNRLTRQGKWYLTSFILILVFTIHSGFVHYHSYTGDLAYKKIVASSFKKNIHESSTITPLLNDALYHLETATRYGIYSPASLNRQLASLYLTAGKSEMAKEQLQNLLNKLPDDFEAGLRFAKLEISDGNDTEARVYLKNIFERSKGETNSDCLIRSEAYMLLGQISERAEILKLRYGINVLLARMQ